MAKSTINLVCPVSGKKAKPILLDEDAPEGEFVVIEPDDSSPRLPVGWGRLTVDIVVPNPAVAEMETARTAEIAMKDKIMADPEVPQEQKDLIAAGFDSTLDERYPLPDTDTLVKRLSFEVLSDEAIGTAIKALKDAGFPIIVEG